MIEINEIKQSDFDMCKKFLLAVPTIKEVDENILKDSILVTDEKGIIGCVAYETFNDAGLVRYFVFKKALGEKLIKEMFDCLEKKALSNDIKKLYCLVNNKNVEELFSYLEFKEISTEYLYIDEQHFSNLDYNDSQVMSKTLKIVA